jgi:hypothetical protein
MRDTRGILALFVVLAILGWVGLAFFTYYNPPDAWNRWVAVTVLWLALWATLLPLVYWFHLRRQRLGAEEGIVPRAARQSALAALFVSVCIWLHMARALNWANLALLLLLLGLTEGLLSTQR